MGAASAEVATRLAHLVPATGTYYFSMRYVKQVGACTHAWLVAT